MIWNYLKTAFRNILRYKIYATINIVGLAIGMASCMLIMLFVQSQLRVDQSYEKADQIYRVIEEYKEQDKTPFFRSNTLGGLGPSLKAEFPEVQESVRLLGINDYNFSLVEGNGKTFRSLVCLADQSALDVFDYPFLKGTPQTAFPTPSSVVLTERTAQQFFGDEDPMGKTLTVLNRHFQGDYTITGIIKNLDETTIGFDIMVTDPTRSQETQTWWDEWSTVSNYRPISTFVLLPKGYNPKTLEQKLPDFAKRHLPPEIAANTTYHLQPLTRIYLYSRTDYGVWYDGIRPIYLLSSIAAFLLLLACINFTNLATARSVGRAREVGLRKVVGAQRGQLIRQFLSEAMLMAFVALFIALGLSELLLPTFNQLINANLTFTAKTFTELLPGFILIALFTGLLAGSYPAFFLSTYQPVETLKGSLKTGSRGIWLRKGLVIFQFAISIFLVIGTLAMRNQLHFMQNQDLGFDPKNIVILPVFGLNQEMVANPEERMSNQYDMVKAAFLQNPNILKASALRNGPFFGSGNVRRIRIESAQNQERQIHVNEVDETFFDTFGIAFAAGHTFSPGLRKEFTSEWIINETAAKQFGWTNPIGKQIEWMGVGAGVVVGMVKDYHFDTLQQRIAPLAFVKRTTLYTGIGFKLREGTLASTLPFLEETWKQFVPTQQFTYNLLEEDIQRYAYFGEQRLMYVASVAAALAILIACLGLFGLAAFSTHQRIKEIGIRKVLGASVGNIVLLLSKDFLILVAQANFIAWPAAYYVMSIWLEQYPYRISLGVSIFLLSGFTAVLIALATVSWQAIKAARSNPVDALKYE